ncbi:MAG TPA: hypothetical protein VF919_03350 [Gemmatimonadales bacterium]
MDYSPQDLNLLATILNSAIAVATVVLTLFAGVQIWQVRKESRERQRAAYASLYAEYFHLSALSDSWANEDLLELARNDALRPEDMLPRDWGTMIRLLGEVGSATGALGGMAYDAVAEAATRVRMLNHLVRNYPPGTADNVGRALEKRIKKGIAVAASTFEDAMHQAPAWLVTHPITIVDPKSEIGLSIQRTMIEAQRVPLRRRNAILGPVGRFIGNVASRIAIWWDPAQEGRFTLSDGSVTKAGKP